MLIYILTFCIVLLYLWHRKKYSFWSSQNVKGPTPLPFFGTMPYLLFDEARYVDYRWSQKYGKVFGDYMGPLPNLAIADPYLAKQILVNDFHIFNQSQKVLADSKMLGSAMTALHGHEWKRVRSAVSPSFTTNKLRRSLIHLNRPVQNFFDNLEQLVQSKTDDQIQIKELTKGYALDVIAKFVFAMEVNSYQQKEHAFVKNVYRLIRFRLYPILLMHIVPKSWIKNVGDLMLDSQGSEYFLKLTDEILKERREHPEIKYKDFVEMLLDSVNQLSDREIMSQCLLFFFGGLDSVSTSLSILMSDMAIHQDAQERIYQEIQNKIGQNEITYEVIQELEYLDAFIHESLRMTPVAVRLMRHPQADYKLGDTGLTLKAGQCVMINVYAIHHDKELYEDPFEFKPERYLPENKNQLYNRFWFGFGDGPRNCVAIRFAMMELKFFLVNLIRNYHIKIANGCPVPVKYKATIFLVTPTDLRMNFTPRH